MRLLVCVHMYARVDSEKATTTTTFTTTTTTVFGLLLPQVSRVIPKGYPHNGETKLGD